MKIGRTTVLISGLLAVAALAGAYALRHLAPHDDVCPAQFAGGKAPDTTSRTGRTICFSQFALRYSPLTRTPMWSAEHLTKKRVIAATTVPRTSEFHEETRVSQASRSKLAD